MMKKISILLVIGAASMSFFSCTDASGKKNEGHTTASFFEGLIGSSKKSTLSVHEYMNWVENTKNGLKVEKEIGDFNFSALYKPYEYLTIMEHKNEKISGKILKEGIKEYEGMQYFTFKITSNNQQKELLKVGIREDQEYYSRLEYLSFEMQKDFKLIEGKDTLDCALYNYERVYGLAPYATMVLGFPLTQQSAKGSQQDKTILYTDKLFGAGNVYMTVYADKLNSIPSLSIQ